MWNPIRCVDRNNLIVPSHFTINDFFTSKNNLKMWTSKELSICKNSTLSIYTLRVYSIKVYITVFHIYSISI